MLSHRDLARLFRFIPVILSLQCTYTVERPIQQKNVNLITPVDHLVTVNTTQTFTWTALQNATYYELELASPDFATATRLVADTTLKGTAFTIVLSPGHYEWFIRGVNFSSVTLYSDTNSFTVH